MSDTASTSVVSAGIISGFERSDLPRRERRNAFAIENSEVDGEASLCESHLDQINEFYICTSIALRARRFPVFIFPG
jgi:hypothetical protein